MMSEDIGIDEGELNALFGKHTSRVYGDDWFDSDSVYEFSDSNRIHITFAIHPIHKDVRITLSTKEVTIYDWHSQDLKDIRTIEDKKGTVIELLISDRDTITVRLKPTIFIEHVTKRNEN
jgi:hypothetical protein